MNQASSHASIFKSRLTLYASLMSAIAMVVPLETQSNLNAAAILLVKAAVEAIWKLVLNQKADLVQSGNPVKPFAILSFAAALSLSMALIKQDGHGKDPLSNVLKTIIGSSEGRPHADEIQPCPHKSFCRFYAMFGFIRSFTIGYIFMFSLSSTRHPIRAIKSNYRLLGSRKSLKFAIFLGTLSAIFKGAMCYQRNANWDLPVKTDPRYQAAISGFLAGLSSIIFPSNQLSSYMIWKTLFSFYRSRVTNRHTGHEASSSRVSRSLMVNLVFIMSASTVLMFYSTRPELLPKSYVRTIENIVPRRYFGQL
ncbi:hypothetical protein HDE_04432 [Halotydeus destructor]|nr:hypothetical protein HDE_04432 [Halotydeus destructor]